MEMNIIENRLMKIPTIMQCLSVLLRTQAWSNERPLTKWTCTQTWIGSIENWCFSKDVSLKISRYNADVVAANEKEATKIEKPLGMLGLQ